MSIMDSTQETCKEISKKYCSTFSMYGEKLELKEDSKILNYAPDDTNKIYESYIVEEDKIYEASLSPSEVYLAIDKITGNKVAIKEVKKEKLKDNFIKEMAKNELIIHASMSQQSNNVVKIHNYYEDDKAFKIAMEFCEEGNYFEDILENRYCPISDEKTLKAYAFDILSALNEIHKCNIIHCDIKPTNFLLFKNYPNTVDDSYSEDYYLKLTDFGFSHVIPKGSSKAFMKLPCGTYYYMAPEITENCYVDTSIDIWSFGVSLYQMAVAYFPTAIKQYKYGTGPIPFRTCDWKGFDFFNVKDLIEKCIQVDPTKRITVNEALNHPWFEE